MPETQTKPNKLERNVQYVVDVVNENCQHGIDINTLIEKTRLKQSEKTPLGLKDAQSAISTAENENLIRKRYHRYFGAFHYYPKN